GPLGKLGWVADDDAKSLFLLPQTRENIEDIAFFESCAIEPVERRMLPSQFNGGGRAIDTEHCRRPATDGIKREATSETEKVQDVTAPAIACRGQTVEPLIEVKAGLLARSIVDAVSQPVLDDRDRPVRQRSHARFFADWKAFFLGDAALGPNDCT